MSLKEWWETWDIHVVVVASLMLQIYLILAAPLRKRISKWFITMPLWLAYLLADVAATYAVGLIAKSQVQAKQPPNADLIVFWAPFLLVHLGGPDTITAFAVEDNELWLRHALSLVVQSSAVAYAFYLSFDDSKLWIPSVLMFVAGFIKYTERTRSLYLASLRRFRDYLLSQPDQGPRYIELVDEYSLKSEARLPTRVKMIPEPNRLNKIENKEDSDPLTDLEVVRRGHHYFMTFKGLVADLIISFHERNVCRDYFLKISSRDAFKIVEVELNFIYDILYTKVSVVQGTHGYLIRIFSFGLICASLVLFKLVDKPKDKYRSFDVGLTYTLLGGAIALDTIAFFMVLFSDWTIVALSEPEGGYFGGSNIFNNFQSNGKKFLSKLLRIDRQRWRRESTEATTTRTNQENEKPHKCSFYSFGGMMETVRRRWSESISQFSLLDYCSAPRFRVIEFIIDFFGLISMHDSIKYVVTKDFTSDLRDLIFHELKKKSKLAEDLNTARQIFSARGDWVLRHESCPSLLPWIDRVDYDESILLWHLATELLYNTDSVRASTTSKRTGISCNLTEEDFKRFSKLLSDYMFYLLLVENTVISTVAGISRIRYRDTCAEAREFFGIRNMARTDGRSCFSKLSCFSSFCGKSSDLESGISSLESLKHLFCCGKEEEISGDMKQVSTHKLACERIVAANSAAVKRNGRSKSVLFEAAQLAKELARLREPNVEQEDTTTNKENKGKWEIMCRVWIELMCYAAIRCKASTHAAQLSKGGQLITLVWLLMAHLSLGNQYEIGEGHVNAQVSRGRSKFEELPMFAFVDLAIATANFNEINKLGQGSFGYVYKGILSDGQDIAVKRLSASSGQGTEEFMNEVLVISNLQHHNLVRLLGCCIEREEKILVYEYMQNKSLDSFLFDPNKKELLHWSKRLNIIEGICRGLHYLHSDSRLRIIHLDLKASKILLDNELNPKISDFGMARILNFSEVQANAKSIVGT